MNHVKIELLGKNYQLACDAGQEEHLHRLAQEVSARIGEMQQRFMASGATPQESMLWVMTAITLMDEIYDLRLESAAWQREAINAAALPAQEEQEILKRLNMVADKLSACS
jgi:cell division protein ZapA